MNDPRNIVMLPSGTGRRRSTKRRFPGKWLVLAAAMAGVVTLALGFGLFRDREAPSPEPSAAPALPPETPLEEAPPIHAPVDHPKPPEKAVAQVLPPPEPVPAEEPALGVARIASPPLPSAPMMAALPASAPAPPAPTAPPVPLPPATGTLEITSEPEAADVYLGERLLGVTPLLLEEFPAGKVSLRLQKERYTRKTVESYLRQGGNLVLEAELQYDPEPRPGDPFTNGQGVRMQWIPALGGWAASVETTQQGYEAITRENPGERVGPDLPVTNVSWTDAMEFCDLLTIAERGIGFLPPGHAYTLPSDEEWSLLAAGTPLSHAVTSLESRREGPSLVGQLPPNGLGLHDIRGNVWEWCRDVFNGDVLRREIQENGTGDETKVNLRHKILRGGSWTRSLESSLATGRRLTADGRSHRDHETGFRMVLLPRP